MIDIGSDYETSILIVGVIRAKLSVTAYLVTISLNLCIVSFVPVRFCYWRAGKCTQEKGARLGQAETFGVDNAIVVYRRR